MASSTSSSLSSTGETSYSPPLTTTTANDPPPPPTTPTGELSTPLDLDGITRNILTTLRYPVDIPTAVPPNTSVGSTGDLDPGPVEPTITPVEEYVPEVNNWADDVQAQFSQSLRGMAQLAVDVHKLDPAKSVAEHYCDLVSSHLRTGPIPFTPPPEAFDNVTPSEEMLFYISDVEKDTREGWDISELSQITPQPISDLALQQLDSNGTVTSEGVNQTVTFIGRQWKESGWSTSYTGLASPESPLR